MSLVILLVCIMIVYFHSINQGKESLKYKKKAELLGEGIYLDAQHKWRSVETDELTSIDVSTGQRRGIYTNNVYSDPVKDRIEKRNEEFRRHNAPVYWGECKPYWDNNREARFHLREVENGRMYKIIGNYKYENARSVTPVTFTIAYLDENHDSVGEYKEISYDLFPVYKGIAYFK